MTKRFILALAAAAACSFSLGAEDLPDWQNPDVFERNRLPMAATFQTDQQQTVSLSGEWKFRYFDNPNLVQGGFEAKTFDDSSWDTMPVPGLWELNGYGDPLYVNIGYAWRGNYESNPPIPPVAENHVGQYRRTFTVPKDWAGKQICLCIGSATSNVRVWVGGKEVGYSQDSKLEARFDITKYVQPGENVIALEIYRWCDGTYLEDQDFWRFSGISRGVWVYTRERKRLEDVHVTADMDGNVSVRAEVSVGLAGADFEVLDASGERVAFFQAPVMRKYDVSEDGNIVLRASAKVDSPLLWSAEEPNLYTLKVTARDKKGVAESASVQFGFRTVEIVNNQLLVNGKPVLIKGVNRHELQPYKGYLVSEADMIRDIRIMKQLNVNAVRTCHYPDDPRWLALCDRYGLYVTDEGNIESHGMGYGPETLAKDPQFLKAHLSRDQRFVRRDFNHPCVIVWSMGNEAGFGPNFEACYRWIKEYDPSRPVQYEQAGTNAFTDIFCPMYLSPDDCVKYLEGNPSKPLIQCEYAHAMGNSMGNFKEYWDLVRKYPSYQGGYIWDFQDQALRMPSDPAKTGSDHYFAYGGDFNRHDASDGSFNCNGVIAADRSLHPHAYEVRYQYRSIHTSLAAPVASREILSQAKELKVNVKNEYFFIDLSRFRMLWNVQVGGRKVLSGVVDNLGVKPGETALVSLGVTDKDLLLAAAGAVSEPGDADIFLNVSYVLKSAYGLLEADEELAYDQIALYEAPVVPYEGEAVAPEMIEKDGLVVLGGTFGYDGGRNAVWEASFNRSTGWLSSYKVDGKELMSEPLMPSFGRAVVENDILGAKMHDVMNMWRYPSFKLSGFEVEKGSDAVVVRASYQPLAGAATVKVSYRIHRDGVISATETMEDAGGLDKLPGLFRFGMRFAMPGSFDTLDFYGLGPWENYVDRCSSAVVGRYVQSVNDQYHYGYVRTQESGTKTGLRYLRVLDASGLGLEVTSDAKFSGSVLPFSQRDLDMALSNPLPRRNPTNEQLGNATHSLHLMSKAHVYDRSAGTTYVNFEAAQIGVGGINTWSTWPLPEYLLPAREREFNFVLRPLDN